MPKQITARVSLDGGSLLSEANMHRITVRSTKPTDRMGNRLSDDYTGQQYFQKWVVKKEPEGFIFREVSHNAGLCGHAANVRQLVIRALFGLFGMNSHLIIEVAD